MKGKVPQAVVRSTEKGRYYSGGPLWDVMMRRSLLPLLSLAGLLACMAKLHVGG